MFSIAIESISKGFTGQGRGFIECTKIRMTKTTGNESLQRSVFSEYKHMHRLVHQTFKTLDGLNFDLFGRQVGLGRNFALYCERSWEETWDQSNQLMETTTTYLVILHICCGNGCSDLSTEIW